MATKEEVTAKVIDITCEQLSVPREKVSATTSFVDDLGADSLDIAELVMEFEDEFDINIPEDEEGIKTVGDAVKFITEKSDG
jgi:acyl carrier protein